MGYWSVDCETWYQTRRTAILANDMKVGKLRNASAWRNTMKFARKQSKMVVDAMTGFSEAILQEMGKQ